MKKVLLAFAIFFSFCGTLLADTDFATYGGTTIPGCTLYYLNSNNRISTNIRISNTTGEDVRCRFTVYDANGNDISNYASVYMTNGSSTAISVDSADNIFSIPALGTRNIQLYTSSRQIYHFCQMLIEWTSCNIHLRKALIASTQTMYYTNGTFQESEKEVNGGQIF